MSWTCYIDSTMFDSFFNKLKYAKRCSIKYILAWHTKNIHKTSNNFIICKSKIRVKFNHGSLNMSKCINACVLILLTLFVEFRMWMRNKTIIRLKCASFLCVCCIRYAVCLHLRYMYIVHIFTSQIPK